MPNGHDAPWYAGAMYSIILAAVDGSERSRGVLARAVGVAERFGGTVHLFRAVPVPQEFPAAAPMPVDPLPEVLTRKTTQWLAELAAGHARVRVEPPDLATTQPWRAIIAAAAKLRADLIVVGSHGFGGWDRVLGTNASKVADHADRDVLVVHEPTPAA